MSKSIQAHNKLKEFQSLENDVCHARCCIGCKWPMDQMCSKCGIHCPLHKLGKYLKLGTSENFQVKFFV